MKLIYRPEIDGLRAIAVISVILYHSQFKIYEFQFFKGGFIGVDIFFVISGYLITLIILKEITLKGNFSFKNFFERRIRRILPAFLFVILVSFPFAWMYIRPSFFLDYSESILYSIGFISNYYFLNSQQEYGAQSSLLIPFLHTWSLSIEEQFYIILPFFLVIISKHINKYLITIIILVFCISFILSNLESRSDPYISFYSLHTRIWELLAGSILAFFEIKLGCRSKNNILNFTMPVVGIILIIFSIIYFDHNILHPSFFTLLPVIGTSLIIWFSNKNEIVNKFLSLKIFVGIGVISYSLYLWHYPILALLREYIWYWQFDNEFIFQFIKIFFIFIIFFLSIFTYFFIEKVARNQKYTFSKILIGVSAGSLVIIFFNILVIHNSGYDSRFHPFLSKYNDEHGEFMKNYNYNNFDKRKNVFILGNSYSQDLLNLMDHNKDLKSQYYFYAAISDDREQYYQINCLNQFLNNKINKCRNNKFSLLKKQYNESEYIIFTQQGNDFFLDENFYEIIKLIKKDNKKYIVFINDVMGADILDYYLKKKNKTPDQNTLSELENEFYINAMKYDGKIIKEIKSKFDKNKIPYLTRSDLYCNKKYKRCDLIKNNDKIYEDSGHITNNGANYFSDQAPRIMNILIN